VSAAPRRPRGGGGRGSTARKPTTTRRATVRRPALPRITVPELAQDPSAAQAIRRAVAASVHRLVRHDPVVRRGEDPEGVHQARVATRRLRSDLRTFSPLLDADWTGRLRDELRDLADLLGAVRDADVLLQRLRAAAATLPDSEGAAAEVLVADLAAVREADRARLLAAMDDPRYATLLADLAEAAAQPAVLDEASQPAAEVLPPLAAGPWRRLRRAVRQLGDDPPDAALHAVRILAKRARYAAEAVAPVAGQAATDFARAVARLQEVLGDHHDAVVAQGWLREAAARHPGEAFAAGTLAGLEQAEAQRCREAWPAAWAAASRKQLRGWM
jgi:CHAD domain-containing protein